MSKHVAIKTCICYSCVDGNINNKINIQTYNGMTSFKLYSICFSFRKKYDYLKIIARHLLKHGPIFVFHYRHLNVIAVRKQNIGALGGGGVGGGQKYERYTICNRFCAPSSVSNTTEGV
jgi:hypothetical protein